MPVRKSGFCLLKKFLLEDKVIAHSWLPRQRSVSLKLEGEETRLFEENAGQDVVTEWILWMTLSSPWLLFMTGTYACKIHKSSVNSKTLHRCLVWEERQSYSSTLASCHVPLRLLLHSWPPWMRNTSLTLKANLFLRFEPTPRRRG